MGLHLYSFRSPASIWGGLRGSSIHTPTSAAIPRHPYPALSGFTGQWENPNSLMLKALAIWVFLISPRYCLSISLASLGDKGAAEVALPLVGES